jgi:hypothetical protein
MAKEKNLHGVQIPFRRSHRHHPEPALDLL